MATSDDSLGGRIALLQPDSLSADQRTFYDQLQSKTIPWAKQSGFRADTDDQKLIGPFNAMLRSPAIAKAVMSFDGAEQENTSLSERVRQVIILTVGAVWQATYELYAHTAVARKAGIAEDTIQALMNGQSPTGLSNEEMLAYTFTRELTTTHRISPDLYQQVINTFDEKGVFDMIALAGQYMSISAILNTFAVPAPDNEE